MRAEASSQGPVYMVRSLAEKYTSYIDSSELTALPKTVEVHTMRPLGGKRSKIDNGYMLSLYSSLLYCLPRDTYSFYKNYDEIKFKPCSRQLCSHSSLVSKLFSLP